MMAIAEAGATKTDWIWWRSGESTRQSMTGFNATTDAPAELADRIPDQLPASKIDRLFFYAAGVSQNNQKSLKELLHESFPRAAISVQTDLMAAARGVLGKAAGTLGLLGTGAGRIDFDGTRIIRRVPSLGYVLGDEGSGAFFGSGLLRHYLRDNLPYDLKSAFEDEFSALSETWVLAQIYGPGSSAQYLASFFPFIASRSQHPFFNEMIQSGLKTYLDQFFSDMPPRVHFCGSVAARLKTFLVRLTRDRPVTVDSIVRSPLEGLIRYHQTYEEAS